MLGGVKRWLLAMLALFLPAPAPRAYDEPSRGEGEIGLRVAPVPPPQEAALLTPPPLRGLQKVSGRRASRTPPLRGGRPRLRRVEQRAGRRKRGKLPSVLDSGRFRGNVAGEVHGIMEDADDLDHLFRLGAIHDDVTTAPTVSCDVQGSNAGTEFITGDRAKDFRVGAEKCDGAEKSRLVNFSLPGSERIPCVCKDPGEILFRLATENDLPHCDDYG